MGRSDDVNPQRSDGQGSDDGGQLSPAISILVPVFRGEAFLPGLFESLRAQTFTDWEVLCIDDCSDDGSAAIIAAEAARDPRIRYLRSPENVGFVPRLLNRFRHEVRGSHFAYSSQDDSFSPDWLASMWATMRETGADAVVPDLVFHDEVRGDFRRLDNSGRAPVSGEEAFFLSLDWTIPGNALWPRRMLEDHGFFEFGMYADEYSARVWFLDCATVAFASGTFRYYQGNPNAITRKRSARRLDYPENEWRLWQLAHARRPGSPPVARHARSVLRALIEARVEIAQWPELAPAAGRLDAVTAGIADPFFRRSLAAAFPSRAMGRAAAALAARPAVLGALARLIALRRGAATPD